MINITDCPITGLQRKLDYNFMWFRAAQQIIIECTISYFKDDEPVDSTRILPYTKNLVASDTLVNPETGDFINGEESPEIENPITEYEYYVNVLGVTPLILPDLIENIILLRDSQGKFNV